MTARRLMGGCGRPDSTWRPPPATSSTAPRRLPFTCCGHTGYLSSCSGQLHRGGWHTSLVLPRPVNQHWM